MSAQAPGEGDGHGFLRRAIPHGRGERHVEQHARKIRPKSISQGCARRALEPLPGSLGLGKVTS